MSAMYICTACGTYHSLNEASFKCKRCGAEGRLWREPEPGEEDEDEGDR